MKVCCGGTINADFLLQSLLESWHLNGESKEGPSRTN